MSIPSGNPFAIGALTPFSRLSFFLSSESGVVDALPVDDDFLLFESVRD